MGGWEIGLEEVGACEILGLSEYDEPDNWLVVAGCRGTFKTHGINFGNWWNQMF